MLTILRKTSLPSSRSIFAGSRRYGAAARITRKGTTVWVLSIAWKWSADILCTGAGSGEHAEGNDRVDVEHRLEVLVGHLVHGRVERVAGVVDDDVDLAEGVDRLLHERVRCAGLRQVAREHRRVAR